MADESAKMLRTSWPIARILVAISVCLVCLALIIVADFAVGPPSNRTLADALGIGG
jgi:hypothetical protein